jgi:hypothetical protein
MQCVAQKKVFCGVGSWTTQTYMLVHKHRHFGLFLHNHNVPRERASNANKQIMLPHSGSHPFRTIRWGHILDLGEVQFHIAAQIAASDENVTII